MRSTAMDHLEDLIGDWKLTMSNAWFLDSLEEEVGGSASFEWLDDSLVVFRWSLGETPPSVCVIGHSDPQGRYYMLYHDDRGVARVFDMEFDGDSWNLLREDDDMYQRFRAEVEAGRIVGAWEASEDRGGTWRTDFDILFEQV